MLERFALLAALLAVPVATPSPSASPPSAPSSTPLKEIVHVRASASCAEIATHANGAISSALRDDVLVSQTIGELRGVDLHAANPIKRQAGLRALGDYAKMLTEQARQGDREVKRLRELAEKSTDPIEHKELKAFADELGGALWRQQKIARDLNGFIATVDAHDMAMPDESQRDMNLANLGAPDTMSVYQPGLGAGQQLAPVPGSLDLNTPLAVHQQHFDVTGMARAAADDFQDRIAGISNDEANAATALTSGAVNGC